MLLSEPLAAGRGNVKDVSFQAQPGITWAARPLPSMGKAEMGLRPGEPPRWETPKPAESPHKYA